MDTKHGIEITARDRLLIAWECSMALVRNYEAYSKETEKNAKVSKLFSQYAEDEGLHASKLLEILHEYEEKQ